MNSREYKEFGAEKHLPKQQLSAMCSAFLNRTCITRAVGHGSRLCCYALQPAMYSWEHLRNALQADCSRVCYWEEAEGALPSALTTIVATTPLWAWILFRVSSTSAYGEREHHNTTAPARPPHPGVRPQPSPSPAPFPSRGSGRERRHYHSRAVAGERRKWRRERVGAAVRPKAGSAGTGRAAWPSSE